jgi:hypothetical protein
MSGDAETVEVPASLTVFGAEPTAVTVTVARQGLGRRVGRAALALAICWPLAVAAVFIPLAHFVLVPGLLVGGVVLAVLKMREEWRIVRVRGACPRCRREQTFEPGGRFATGRTFECPQCLNTLRLAVAPASPGDGSRSG